MTDIDWKARAEAAEARLEAHIAYSCDLQRIIEAICHGRKIRTPETPARFHYDMAVAYRSRLTITDEMVERMLDVFIGDKDWRGLFNATGLRRDMRAALTAAMEGKQ